MSFFLGAALGLQALGGLASYQGAKEDAKNQRAFQRETARVARASADASFAWGTRSLARQESQEIQAIALEDLNAQREFMRSFGTARAIAAEMGVEGASIDQALGDYVAAEGQRAMVMDVNERNRRVQRTQDFATLGTNRLNQINQFAVQQTVRNPSPFVAATTIASGMLNTYAAFTGPIFGNQQGTNTAPQDPGRIYPESPVRKTWRL